jgi:hypothetical protein
MKPVRTIRPQTRIQWGEQAAEVDVAIAPLVLEIWKAGWITVQSCQRHPATGKVWIQFLAAHQAEDFLNVVAPYEEPEQSIYRRARHWYFGAYEPKAGPLSSLPVDERLKTAWEFHITAHDVSFDDEGRPVVPSPCFSLQVSLLFPRRDLKAMVTRLQRHNARGAEGELFAGVARPTGKRG